MHRRGRHVGSPAQAREVVLARSLRSANAERAWGAELRMAADDRACARASGVYAEQKRAERALLAAVSPADVATLEDLARARRAATERATRLLGRADISN
jgi:hypothetical protein